MALLFNNMHKRVNLKKSIEPEIPAIDVEASVNTEESEDESINDQNSIANMVIKLFNKKVRSIESQYEKCL